MKYKLVLSVLVATMLLCAASAFAQQSNIMVQDSVQVDPKHYKVELENDRVRVVRISYGPREKSVMHEHPPGIVVFLSDFDFKFTYPDGRTENIQGKDGQFLWVAERLEHLPENLGDTGFEAIYIDLKPKEGGNLMATEENKAVVRRFWEGFNAHNLEVWDEVSTSNFMNHDPSLPTPHADLQTTKQIIGGIFFPAFPDLTSSEEDLIAEGNKVVIRRTFRGTHKGELMGVAPTGKEGTWTGIFIARLTGGKIAEQWVIFDALSMLQQIGAVPAPGQGAR